MMQARFDFTMKLHMKYLCDMSERNFINKKIQKFDVIFCDLERRQICCTRKMGGIIDYTAPLLGFPTTCPAEPKK